MANMRRREYPTYEPWRNGIERLEYIEVGYVDTLQAFQPLACFSFGWTLTPGVITPPEALAGHYDTVAWRYKVQSRHVRLSDATRRKGTL